LTTKDTKIAKRPYDLQPRSGVETSWRFWCPWWLISTGAPLRGGSRAVP